MGLFNRTTKVAREMLEQLKEAIRISNKRVVVYEDTDSSFVFIKPPEKLPIKNCRTCRHNLGLPSGMGTCTNPDMAGKERFCAEHDEEMQLRNVYIGNESAPRQVWTCLSCVTEHGKIRGDKSHFIQKILDEDGNIIGYTCPFWACLLPENPW